MRAAGHVQQRLVCPCHRQRWYESRRGNPRLGVSRCQQRTTEGGSEKVGGHTWQAPPCWQWSPCMQACSEDSYSASHPSLASSSAPQCSNPEGSTGSSMVFFRHQKPPSTMHQTTAAESHARRPPQLPASLKHPLEASTPLALRVCTCHWAVLLVELVDVHLKIGGAWQGRGGDGRNGHMEQCRCQTTACKA